MTDRYASGGPRAWAASRIRLSPLRAVGETGLRRVQATGERTVGLSGRRAGAEALQCPQQQASHFCAGWPAGAPLRQRSLMPYRASTASAGGVMGTGTAWASSRVSASNFASARRAVQDGVRFTVEILMTKRGADRLIRPLGGIYGLGACIWSGAAAPAASTITSTSTLPVFWKVRVIGNIWPSFSGAFSPISMM